MMDGPDVSVVIPAHNAEVFLGAELAALAGQEYAGRWEVVVVDNECTDGTVRVAEQWSPALPDLRVVTCRGAGVNRARNAGVRAARAPKVLICDADDIVGDGWLRAMADALDVSDVVGGTVVTDLDPGIVGADRVGMNRRKLPKSLGHLPYALGCNMGFRRDVFDAVDGFDESFAGGGDEVDFCWRAQYAGRSIAHAPEAVLHYRMRSDLRSFARQNYGYALGTARLCSKHIALGRLPRPRARQQLRVLGQHLRRLARVDLLVRARTRRDYVRRLVRFAGSVNGFMSFGVLV